MIDSPGIPQIAASFSLILLPFRSPDKAEPVRLEADPSDFEPPPGIVGTHPANCTPIQSTCRSAYCRPPVSFLARTAARRSESPACLGHRDIELTPRATTGSPT